MAYVKLEDVLPEFGITEISLLKTAIWQYLIDHAAITKPGDAAKVHMFLTTEEEFWGRVQARLDGRYKREDLQQFTRDMEFGIRKAMLRQENSTKLNALASAGSFRARLALQLRRWANVIQGNILGHAK